MHVTLDVGLAFQLGAHALHRLGQLPQFAAAHSGRLGALPLADRLGIASELAQCGAEPPGQPRANQQAKADQPGTEPAKTRLRALDIGLQGAVGFGHRDHANDLLAIPDRCGDIHHRRVGIVRVFAGRAGAVLAAQGQQHIVPARIILADRQASGVEQDDALGVGDVDAVVDLGLGQPPDAGLGWRRP